jgi:formylglycine-generating enzyme required for sulfatase activity
VRIRDARGERLYRAHDFPLVAGGAGAADVELPGFPPGARVAVLGMAEGGLYWQSTPDEGGLDGVEHAHTRWLAPGDVLQIGGARLRCEQAGDGLRLSVAAALDTATLPPDLRIEPALREVHVTGAGDDAIEAAAFRATRTALQKRKHRNPWSIAGMAGLAVFAVIVWFLVTSTAVQFNVEPAADSLSVNGGLSLRFAGHWLLRPGAYTMNAEKAGYEPLHAPIEVTSDSSTQQFSFTLVKLPGLLSVRTKAENAEVYVDGTRAGNAPLDRFAVKPGDHVIAVKAPRYLPQEQPITIQGGGVEQPIEVTLAPGWASVSLDSSPPGAELRVDDVVVGTTPLTVDVDHGERALELKLTGFKSWRQTLVVEAGVAQQLPAVALVKADGLIDVRTSPSGAAVTVDGRFRGETPLELELAPGRSYRVSLSKAGYAAVTRTLEPVSGQDSSLSVTLEGMLGVVRVATDPPDSEIYVDGTARGTAPQSIELTAVPHRIEVRKAGYATQMNTITPRPGFEQQVLVSLQTEQVARRAALSAQITTQAGQTLVLVTSPGRFEMGASRREPGRRANEAVYEVNLQRAFYIGTKEISNKEFRAFDANHQSGTRDTFSLDDDGQPVVRVSWEDAARFCNWLSDKEGLPHAYSELGTKVFATSPMTTGYRLPTEAEWTWVARYAGHDPLRYPWGNEMPPTPKAGNFADQSARATVHTVIDGYDDGFPVTAPPGSFAPTSLGLYDLGGNVAEWTHDLYTIEASSGFEVAVDPTGPNIGDQHVIRGSSYLQGEVATLRLTYRDYGSDSRDDLGFRIARYAE